MISLIYYIKSMTIYLNVLSGLNYNHILTMTGVYIGMYNCACQSILTYTLLRRMCVIVCLLFESHCYND